MADDLDRSYYVYLHIDKATGVPLYVGKGKDRRAQNTEDRSSHWHSKVASLTDGYVVELAAQNLTELEAWDRERELILKHGRLCDGNGTLVNIQDGGEESFLVQMEIKLPDAIGELLQRDFESRQYHQPGADEQTGLLDRLEKRLEEFERDSGIEEEVTNLEMAFGQVIWQVQRAIKFRRRRSLSWKEFAYEVDTSAEEIEDEIKDALDGPGENRPALIELAGKLRQVLLCEIAKFTVH